MTWLERDMTTWQFSPEVQQLFEDVLVWIGFGTVVGLLAKAIMPGRDPGGPIVTVILGIAGSVIGCGLAGCFIERGRITPISLVGAVVAVAGAFGLLALYRWLGGPALLPATWISNSNDPRSASGPRRSYSSAMYED
jgi:uncharacterized membrane protein YeaQ/YmgE (transglycosylase-associated protein family)